MQGKLSPFQYHKLNPRQRMAAALSGLAGFSEGVQVRENDAATMLVPNSGLKRMVQSTLTAPVVGSGLIPSRVMLTPAHEKLDLRTGSVLNPPRYEMMEDPRRYASEAHRFAGLGLTLDTRQGMAIPTGVLPRSPSDPRSGITAVSPTVQSRLDTARAQVDAINQTTNVKAAAMASRLTSPLPTFNPDRPAVRPLAPGPLTVNTSTTTSSAQPPPTPTLQYNGGGSSGGSDAGSNFPSDQLIDGGPVQTDTSTNAALLAQTYKPSMPSWTPWAVGAAFIGAYFFFRRG